MSDFQLLPLTGELLYTFDFSAEVPESVDVESVAYTVPAQLTQMDTSDDLDNARSTILLKASASGKHAMTLQVQAQATLSNSEKLDKYMTVRLSGS